MITTKKESHSEDLNVIGNFQDFHNSDDEELQLRWIKGIIEQIDFANNPEVLPDFVLYSQCLLQVLHVLQEQQKPGSLLCQTDPGFVEKICKAGDI